MPLPRRSLRVAALFGMFLLAAVLLFSAAPPKAQTAPPGPLRTQPGIQPEQAPPPAPTIRVQVSEVAAPVTVTGKSGEMILSLKQTDFHVYDDGVERPIQHFALGGQPLSIVLLLENSSRVEPQLPAVRKMGVVFAQPVLGQTAEAAIVEYDDSVHVLQKFTTDPDALEHAINTIEPGNGGSNLYDAMQRGISLLQERPQDQCRILLVVGESQDTGSGSKLGEVLRRAQISNVTIYSVGLSTASAQWRSARKNSDNSGPAVPPIRTGNDRQDEMNRQMQSGADLMGLAIWLLQTGKNALGPNSLAVASKATGGLHISTFKDRSIEKAMDAIGGELHAQYTIGFQPPADKPSGYHEIKITVDRPGATLRTRPGYYLADEDSPSE